MTKKIAIIGTAAILAIASLFISVVASVYAGGNYQYYFDKVAIKEKYSVGETIAVPECNMHYGDQLFDTSFKVVFPDGRERFEQSIVLDQKGSYKLIYEGRDADRGNTRTNVLEFSVASRLYEIVGSNASSEPKYVKTQYNGASGVVANIMNGDALRFNKTIDLSKLTKEEGIVEFFHVPTNPGYLDGFFKITLTDAYNDENSVSILVRKYNEESTDGWYNAYIMVSFNDSDEVGLRFNNNKNNGADSVYYNGAWHQLDRNNDLGTCINYSMIGTPRYDVPLGGETLKFSYDYEQKIVYANGVFVCDLDDTVFFSNTFKGFTTGEVFLSISGFNYAQSTINPVILGVAQMDVSKNLLFDNQAPVIKVDTSNFDGQIKGVKGKEFTLLPAVATDKIDGELQISAKVYRNYYSSKIFVPTFDGKFLPDTNAKYYIEYSATDYSGNCAKEIVTVDVLEKVNTLDFSVEGLNLADITAGERVVLLDGITAFGDVYGNVTTVKIIAENLSNGEQIVIEDYYSFLPLLSGNYKLIISLSDYVETVTKTFDFSVNIPNAPIFIGEPFVEKYYIKGATYLADEFCGYNVTQNGREEVNTDVYVKEDDKDYVKLNGKFIVGASETVQFKYVAGQSVYYTKSAQVVDVSFGENLDLAGYFYGDVAAQTTKEYVKYTTNRQANGISRFDFINSVQAENLTLSLGFDKVADEFEKFDIYITDAYNENNSIKLSFTTYKGRAAFQLNDGDKIILSKDYTLSQVLYNIGYNNSDKTVKVDGETFLNVKTNSLGQPFEGFVDYDVYLSFEFVGVKAQASVNIYALNGQTFNSNNFILPPVFTHVVCVGEVSVGQTFKMSKIIVDDVLDPFVTISDFYVTIPSGDYAYSVDGVKLDNTADYTRDYYIQATEYGAYTIYLNAYNSSEKYSYLPVYEEVHVVDMTAPTIELEENLPSTVKVGKSVKIPKVKISDDYSAVENLKLYTVVRFADGTFCVVNDGEFKADKKGEYTVIFALYDQNQNMAVLTAVVKAQ